MHFQCTVVEGGGWIITFSLLRFHGNRSPFDRSVINDNVLDFGLSMITLECFMLLEYAT